MQKLHAASCIHAFTSGHIKKLVLLVHKGMRPGPASDHKWQASLYLVFSCRVHVRPCAQRFTRKLYIAPECSHSQHFLHVPLPATDVSHPASPGGHYFTSAPASRPLSRFQLFTRCCLLLRFCQRPEPGRDFPVAPISAELPYASLSPPLRHVSAPLVEPRATDRALVSLRTGQPWPERLRL